MGKAFLFEDGRVQFISSSVERTLNQMSEEGYVYNPSDKVVEVSDAACDAETDLRNSLSTPGLGMVGAAITICGETLRLYKEPTEEKRAVAKYFSALISNLRL